MNLFPFHPASAKVFDIQNGGNQQGCEVRQQGGRVDQPAAEMQPENPAEQVLHV